MSDFIWVEKYRPKTIDECILPESIKKTFQDFLVAGEIPKVKSGLNVKCGISVSVHLAILSGSFQVPGKVYTGGHAKKIILVISILFSL